MDEDVPADSLQVGDVVHHVYPNGSSLRVRLTAVQHRIHGIKLVGRNEHGTQYSFGLKYGQVVTRLDELVDIGQQQHGGAA
ncbi:hypothetical protein K7640_15690 [Micromonospora sp. PLK6-60]|uniref:hypothetical protein n=1 Tax=Micromonospora sp. PLK6-60 TaxID=2873383 RepID=UPI001CA69B38|nr:hypothetical protein [Micromonospora sp. PLK6-60]MBY8873277.1 hypothetical protein [Micromonospora sp. PLK6-60]